MGEGGAPQPKDWFLYKKKEMWTGTQGENHVQTEAEMEPDCYQPRSTPGGRLPPTSDTASEVKDGFSVRDPETNQPCGHPDLGFLASRTVRE